MYVVQAGFRQGRGTRDHIFNLRMIIHKCREFNQPLFTCFVDYTKAFDSVEHQQLWTVMREMGFPKRIVSLIEALLYYTVNNNLQSEHTAEQQTGLVLAKACDRAVLCHLIYSVYIHREHNERSGRRTDQQ